MKNPKVTVLMSVYDAEKYLRNSVDSILNQTFRDFEFLIINDGSSYKATEIINSYNDSRMRIINNQKNIGLSKSLNKGLSIARGNYIARMDADDISLPERLAKQVNFLETHQDVDVLGSAVQIIGDDEKPSILCQFPTVHGYIKWCLYFYNPIPHPTVMMRRQALERVSGYSSSMIYAQDYDLWRRMSGVARFANLPDVLLYLRKHESNISNSHLIQQWKDSIKISRQIISGVVGRKVPINVVQRILSQQFKTLDEALDASKIILRLYHTSIANGTLSQFEKRMVRKDVASRLFNLSLPRMRNIHIWPILGLVCLSDPLLVGRTIITHSRKVINKLFRL